MEDGTEGPESSDFRGMKVSEGNRLRVSALWHSLFLLDECHLNQQIRTFEVGLGSPSLSRDLCQHPRHGAERPCPPRMS